MLGKIARVLDRAFFRPDSLHPDVVTSLALAGPVIAGLILFRQPALEFLGMAVAIGGAVHLGARLLRVRLETSPILSPSSGWPSVAPSALPSGRP